MTSTKRPRVAAIGLSDAQIASIEPLCGELRPAGSLSEYLLSYSWTETDVMVAGDNPRRSSRKQRQSHDYRAHLISMVGQVWPTWRWFGSPRGNN